MRPWAAILTYHSLDDDGSVLSTPPAVFAEQMAILDGAGIRVVPLETLPRDARTAGREPVVAITFDDGFRNVYEHGLPVLLRYGLPATVFLVTSHCGSTNSWPGQPRHLGGRPLLSWAQIKEMAAAGMSVGSHSSTHPDLRRLGARQVDAELAGSKRAIEDALGRPVDTFAYPYGAYDERVKERVRVHFARACATSLGFVTLGSDPLALERLDMYYFRRPARLARLFVARTRAYVGVRRGLRACRQWLSASPAPLDPAC